MPGFEHGDAELSRFEQERLEARRGVESWLARFAPLVMDEGSLEERVLRKRLGEIEKLRTESGDLAGARAVLSPMEDGELLATFEMARGQLSGLEGDLRRRLHLVAPGDAASQVDLDALQERLARRAAREEAGAETVLPEILERVTSAGNWGAAASLFLFGLVWNGFTTVHAVLMIGGLWQTAGPLALFLLLFYVLFWAVGLAMWSGAYLAGLEESFSLAGSRLTVLRRFAGWESRREYEVDVREKARFVRNEKRTGNRGPLGAGVALGLKSMDGKRVSLLAPSEPARRKELLGTLNAYLARERERSGV